MLPIPQGEKLRLRESEYLLPANQSEVGPRSLIPEAAVKPYIAEDDKCPPISGEFQETTQDSPAVLNEHQRHCFNNNHEDSAQTASLTAGRNFDRFWKHIIYSQKCYPGSLAEQMKDQKVFQKSKAMARRSITKASKSLMSYPRCCLDPPRRQSHVPRHCNFHIRYHLFRSPFSLLNFENE